MATSAVSWEELGDSPQEKGDREGNISATRMFKVSWSDRYTFYNELLYGGTSGLPSKYPGTSALYCSDVQMSAFQSNPSGGTFTDPETDLNSHDYAILTAQYEPLTFDATEFEDPSQQDPTLPSGTYASYDRADSADLITVPGRSLIWDSDDEPVNADAHSTMLVPTVDHIVTWERVVRPPWSTISAMKGKVNSVEFRIPATGQRAAADTLLFMGATSKRTFGFDGNNFWTLTYTFKERSVQNLSAAGEGAMRDHPEPTTTTDNVVGWQHVWRDSPAKWDKPKDNVSEDFMYQSDNFTGLFVFA